MKKLPLITLLLCLVCGLARAVTVSGVVTNATTSAPVAGQKVFILDSLNNFQDSAITNSSGAYSFTIGAAVTSSDPILVWTTACGTYYRNFLFKTGTSLVSNFSVCGSGIQLNGLVNLGSTANNGTARVYLIQAAYDPRVMDTVLTAIDSFSTAATGGSFSRNYSSVPSGKLLLKAALLPSHPQYSNFLPTYYSSSITWSGATRLSSVAFLPYCTTIINMTSGTNSGGPGFIGGQVTLGANKTTAVGDPLSGRILILTTSSGSAVAYTYTDGSGNFSFPSLAYGTYKLFGDALGKDNPALEVTISASKPSITSLTFEENSKEFKAVDNTEVKAPTAFSSIKLYPNPANNRLYLSGLSTLKGEKLIHIQTLSGSIVTSLKIQTSLDPSINLEALPTGMYQLIIKAEAGTANYRFLKR